MRRNPKSDAAIQKEIAKSLQFNTIAALQLCVEAAYDWCGRNGLALLQLPQMKLTMDDQRIIDRN